MTTKKIKRTIRMTKDTEDYIEATGKGSNFSESFDNMIDIFSGNKTNELLSEINDLEKRCEQLTILELKLTESIDRDLKEFEQYISDVKRNSNNLRNKVK